MQSVSEYFKSNYPSESVPEPQSGPGAGDPLFAVRGGQTSADSTPQPDVALPSTALPNDIAAAKLNGGAGYSLLGTGYRMNDNLQYRSTINAAGQFSTELCNDDVPVSTPYPADPKPKRSQ